MRGGLSPFELCVECRSVCSFSTSDGRSPPKPNGRIGIINYKPGSGGPGPEPGERVASTVVEEDARTAKLRVLLTTDLRYQYLVVTGLRG